MNIFTGVICTRTGFGRANRFESNRKIDFIFKLLADHHSLHWFSWNWLPLHLHILFRITVVQIVQSKFSIHQNVNVFSYAQKALRWTWLKNSGNCLYIQMSWHLSFQLRRRDHRSGIYCILKFPIFPWSLCGSIVFLFLPVIMESEISLPQDKPFLLDLTFY